ncbi:MAG: cytochrome c [Ignavibacteria bacterium]|nr:cytochrome c [Ignavibacteria bacterium]
MRKFVFYIVLLLLVLSSIFWILNIKGKFYFRKNIPNLEIIDDMDKQENVRLPYADTFLNQRTINLLPIDESYSPDIYFYPYLPYEFEFPQVHFENPLPPTAYVLKKGETLFKRFCVSCHNFDGKGNGPIITQVQLKEDEEGFPQPKDLTSASTWLLSDGRLFHILSAGQNLMFHYNDKLSFYDKWCLIHYLRELQKNNKRG